MKRQMPSGGKAPAPGAEFPFNTREGREAILATYDRLTARWPVSFQQRTVPTSLGAASAIEWGSPEHPVLVLVHGSSSNAATWLGDAAAYGADHHVFAVDLPGECGRSDPRRPVLEGAAYAAWLGEVIDSLVPGNEPIRLVGMSLGGWVSMQYAFRYAERVEKLGLLCPAGLGPIRRSFLLLAIISGLMGDAGKKRLIRHMAGNVPLDEEFMDFMMQITRSFQPITAPIPPLEDSELGLLTMPVRMLLGGRDTLIDSAASRKRAARLLPNADVVWLPDASHMLVNRAGDLVPFLTEPHA